MTTNKDTPENRVKARIAVAMSWSLLGEIWPRDGLVLVVEEREQFETLRSRVDHGLPAVGCPKCPWASCTRWGLAGHLDAAHKKLCGSEWSSAKWRGDEPDTFACICGLKGLCMEWMEIHLRMQPDLGIHFAENILIRSIG